METKKYKVGILGYGGKTGHKLVELISSQYSLRLGQRSVANHSKYPDAEYIKIDIFNIAELVSFLNGLDVVVNCAGPSYKIKDYVALAAAKLNIAYIDAFGADMVEHEFNEGKGQFIIGAGSFPGFSGILPIYLAKEYEFENIDSIHMISCSNEINSYASVIDFILSSVNQFGKANYYYLGGNTLYCDSTSNKWLGFDSKDIFSEYINAETIQVAKKINAYEMHWINVQKNNGNIDHIKNITMDFIKNNDDEKLEKAVKEYIDKQQVDNGNYKIACYMQGMRHKLPTTVYSLMEFEDSYQINAQILALVIDNLVHDTKAINTLWAFEYLNPEKTVKKISNSIGMTKMSISLEISKEEIGEI